MDTDCVKPGVSVYIPTNNYIILHFQSKVKLFLQNYLQRQDILGRHPTETVRTGKPIHLDSMTGEVRYLARETLVRLKLGRVALDPTL